MEKSGLHALHDLDSIATWLIAHGKMEHARITLITAHAAKVTVIRHVITGGLTNIQISTPLKIVKMAANLTEIARIAIDQVSVLPEVIMGLGLVPSNQACAHLMIKSTMNTNAVATRTNLIRMSIVQVIVEILNIPIHVHNIKAGIHTGAHKLATTTATVDNLAVMIVIKDKLATMTATVDGLAVMIAISGHLVMRQVLIHITHAGRVVRQGNMPIIQEGPLNLRDTEQNRSYSKATTSILTQTTPLNHTLVKPELIQRHRSHQKNAMSHAYLMAGY
jgi:hypothetical protein